MAKKSIKIQLSENNILDEFDVKSLKLFTRGRITKKKRNLFLTYKKLFQKNEVREIYICDKKRNG